MITVKLSKVISYVAVNMMLAVMQLKNTVISSIKFDNKLNFKLFPKLKRLYHEC